MPKQEHERTSAATGAYQWDGRYPGWRSRAGDSGWHPQLDHLVRGGHIFLGYRFSQEGVLFRGMPSGFLAGLQAGAFWHSQDAAPLCQLERDLDVIFCSETPSDALSAARPWQDHKDAAVLVFDSEHYAARWRQRAAAVLGFADVGMVFKYPCLVEPLRWSDLTAVLIAPETLERARRLPDCERIQKPECSIHTPCHVPDSRDSWYVLMENTLKARQLVPARTETCDEYPRNQHSVSGDSV